MRPKRFCVKIFLFIKHEIKPKIIFIVLIIGKAGIFKTKYFSMNETMGSYEVTHKYIFQLLKNGVSIVYYFR